MGLDRTSCAAPPQPSGKQIAGRWPQRSQACIVSPPRVVAWDFGPHISGASGLRLPENVGRRSKPKPCRSCASPSSAAPWLHWSQLSLPPALRAQVSWGSLTGKLVSPLRAANARMTLSSASGATHANLWTATSLTIASPTLRHRVTASTANAYSLRSGKCPSQVSQHRWCCPRATFTALARAQPGPWSAHVPVRFSTLPCPRARSAAQVGNRGRQVEWGITHRCTDTPRLHG